jgi:hypothetical protein
MVTYLPSPPQPPLTGPPAVFNIPIILDTASFGAVLVSQRTLIDRNLDRLAVLPLRSAQGAVLAAELRRHLLVHAETLDRAAAFSRQVSVPGSMSERFRQDAVVHDWNCFRERRRRFEDLVKTRSEAEWVRHSWSGFDRGDLVGAEIEDDEEEEEEGNDEAVVGLAEWVKELVDMEELEWAPDAVETLVVVAEGWAARWLFRKPPTHI